MTQSIFISAGEASGDLHAANLVKALRQINPTVTIDAMGGNNLKTAGANIIQDCAELAVMGLVEVLLNYRKLKAALEKVKQFIISEKPDLLILVDYQEFNMKLAEAAKQHGVKILFYIGPQVWAWRSHRVYKMKEKIDMMAVLFPFEVDFYEKAAVPVRFVGNPLVDEVKPSKSKEALKADFELQPNDKVIGLLPGSRRSEISKILPIQLASAQRLNRENPKLIFILAVASTIEEASLIPYLEDYQDLNIKIIKDAPYDVMAVCDSIITASGTATLEAGLMQVPLVITHKIAPLSYAILRRMMTIDKVGLVNIVAEKMIVKELIQNDAKPALIAKEVLKTLNDREYRDNMITELKQLKAKLGKSGGSKLIAELANEMLTTA